MLVFSALLLYFVFSFPVAAAAPAPAGGTNDVGAAEAVGVAPSKLPRPIDLRRSLAPFVAGSSFFSSTGNTGSGNRF